MNFERLSYQELVDDYFNKFLTEYGRLKFEKINRKIQDCKKLKFYLQTK